MLDLLPNLGNLTSLKLGLVTTLPLTLQFLYLDNGDNDAGLVYEKS